ncbi:MAG: bifunctional precorrin-2 dehydrogenase/sirohydrochlorin ferrochelatase [Candidatus Rokubacteria bacterium]|nr:bifunctional precorrin-2 dehydrogenase/sirohydrochlorin ferrochelatase [Candidatus Rokubacteria bacterium]
MSAYFPAFLDLRGRRCLVVGGGEIGERKARALVECGARVVVVSPAVTPGLAALAAAGAVELRPRRFRKADTRGATLVIAATGDAVVDGAAQAAARRRRALVNVVDRPAQCDFILPSVLRRGALQIAVSTGGESPALAREIRKRLERLVGPEYAGLVARVGAARRRARAAAPTAAARLAAGERVVRLALAGRAG